MNTASQLDQVFSALADPTRREVLRLLSRGPTTVTGLADNFRISLPAISRHVKILSAARLVRVRMHAADRRVKQCELDPQGVDAVARWVETSRAAWTRRFDAMERILDRKARGGAT